MEWKWIKTLLIFFFIGLNCFLGIQVYQRNVISLVNSETIDSVNTILDNRNIKCKFNLEEVQVKKYMRKISISNDKNIEESFITLNSIEEKPDYVGRNREIISLQAIIPTFIRESKIQDVNIENITLGYYPEMSQIDKSVLLGEATPAWLIELENGDRYIYNAYIGEKMD